MWLRWAKNSVFGRSCFMTGTGAIGLVERLCLIGGAGTRGVVDRR
jgi:hypothetical protein